MWLRAYSSAFPRIATAQVASSEELFHRDAIVQRMVGIKQQGEGRRRIGGYPHRGDVAHFVLIGDRADRALRRLKDAQFDGGGVRQQRTAPAPRTKGADRRQRQQLAVQRQNGALGGKIIGGRSGRGGDQNPKSEEH